MPELEDLINKLTFEDIEYLAKRGIATYLDNGTINPELAKYINNKEEK